MEKGEVKYIGKENIGKIGKQVTNRKVCRLEYGERGGNAQVSIIQLRGRM